MSPSASTLPSPPKAFRRHAFPIRQRRPAFARCTTNVAAPPFRQRNAALAIAALIHMTSHGTPVKQATDTSSAMPPARC